MVTEDRCSLEMLTGNKSFNRCLMAVGAHADDIEIGVGGTLEKYFRQGYEIVYVMSTNNMSGEVSELGPDGKRRKMPDEPNTAMMARRQREAGDAAREWKTTPVHLNHPQRHYLDENLETITLDYGAPRPACTKDHRPSILAAGEDPESLQRVTDLILEKNPECVLTHPLATYNPEHFGTTFLVTNAYWNAVEQGFQGGLLYWMEHYTRYGSTYLRWDTFVNYSPLLDRKMELLGKHKCQMPTAHLPEFGHRHLSLEFGKACGCLAAEAFIWANRPSHTDGIHPLYGSLTLELYQNAR